MGRIFTYYHSSVSSQLSSVLQKPVPGAHTSFGGYFLKALQLMTNLLSARLVIDNALGFSESELIMERGSLGVSRVTITEFHKILLLYYFSAVFAFPCYSTWFRYLKWLEAAVTTLIVQVGPGWPRSGDFSMFKSPVVHALLNFLILETSTLFRGH